MGQRDYTPRHRPRLHRDVYLIARYHRPAMAKQSKDNTPAMRQYHGFKQRHPDCVLLFRLGDFYEMFYDDAELAHRVLGLTCTHRNGIPMAGVPYHAVENYLRRFIEAGHRVAVCDQVEDASVARGLVRRDVTRVITPGTLTDESLLADGRENPLAALALHGQNEATLAWIELSTGHFTVARLPIETVADELARVAPRELLHEDTPQSQNPWQTIAEAGGAVLTPRPSWQFRQGEAVEVLQRQYQVATLEGFGFRDDDEALRPAGAVVHYLLETQKRSDGSDHDRLQHLLPPKRFQRDHHMVVDQNSLRSLEIDQTLRDASTDGSLVHVLQQCTTSMGKRMLRQWLCYPLRNLPEIQRRQRMVGALVDDPTLLEALQNALKHVHDVPRIAARLAIGRAAPRDLVALGRSTGGVEALAEILAERPVFAEACSVLRALVEPMAALSQSILGACVDEPPAHLREGGLFRDGHDAELDTQRALQTDSHTWLADYQKRLIEETGVTSLKVAYNKVFGYYIELTAANRDRAPETWSRKQTLKNAERFITPELKTFEGKVLSARQHAIDREQTLFAALCDRAAGHLHLLQRFSDAVSQLDVLACFAHRAVRCHYTCPEVVEEPVLQIEAGRHPVLDELLGDRFVPNDVTLGATKHLALITGPNMAGKSTYIRQTALIVLLAHTGAFVPARRARIGLCDRIFTRVGANDELHAGRSTFMVEMTETASICHHATASSLVILDEVGRGTSTLDGLSLAWALVEHLASRGCRTLFATHYHELTALADSVDAVTNLHVTVREWNDEIVFLHRIVPGATDRSYGLHVARLAGVPETVLQRAGALLEELQVSHQGATTPAPLTPRTDPQLSLFTEYMEHPVLESLRRLNLDAMRPLDAMDELRRLLESLQEAPTEKR